MQKCIDRGPEMQIRSAIALDHLKNYVYIEADKEAHVREVYKLNSFLFCFTSYGVCILNYKRSTFGGKCKFLIWFTQAIKGMRNIFTGKIMLVPIKEMTDVLSVESKAIDISRDTWVRMKIGNYKGDLAKVYIVIQIFVSFILLFFLCFPSLNVRLIFS